jgi:hypothetical protein
MLKRLLTAALIAASPAAFGQTATAPVALDGTYISTSYAVTGGTVYIVKDKAWGGSSAVFVGAAAGGMTRYLPLMLGRGDTGLVLTATAGSGAFGISRTTGTSLLLTGETANTGGTAAQTDKVAWEFNLPDTYVAGANLAFVINASIAGASCAITAGSTTLTPTLYTEVNGVEAAATGGITGATQFGKTAANYTFTVVGTGLTPGAHVVFEVVMLVTASGANNCNGQINAVSYTG